MEDRNAARPRYRGPAKAAAPPPRGAQTPPLRPPGNANEQWVLDPGDLRRQARIMRERERVGPLGRLVRSVAVVLLLAGAGAVYWNFDTLRETSVDFSQLTDLVARRVADSVRATGPDGGPTQTEIVKETEVAGAAAPSSLASNSPVADTRTAPERTTHAPLVAESRRATTSSEPSAPREAPPAAVAPGPPPGPEQFSFGLDKIEVSEAAASADLLILRSGDMRRPSTVTWWTTDGTATAGQDYANLGRVVVKFAAHEQNRGIHIPIIGDSNVEGPETFYVNLAPGDNPTAEPTEKLQVIIKDDD